MYAPMIFIAMIPLVVAWFGAFVLWGRVEATARSRKVDLAVGDLRRVAGLGEVKRVKEREAQDLAALGNAVREIGLELLEKEGNRLAAARRKGAMLHRLLPALVVIFVVFSVLSKRIPTGWAIAGGALVMGVWMAMRLGGMAIEMEGVKRGVVWFRREFRLRRGEDEEELVKCARASVWLSCWPWGRR